MLMSGWFAYIAYLSNLKVYALPPVNHLDLRITLDCGWTMTSCWYPATPFAIYGDYEECLHWVWQRLLQYQRTGSRPQIVDELQPLPPGAALHDCRQHNPQNDNVPIVSYALYDIGAKRIPNIVSGWSWSVTLGTYYNWIARSHDVSVTLSPTEIKQGIFSKVHADLAIFRRTRPRRRKPKVIEIPIRADRFGVRDGFPHAIRGVLNPPSANNCLGNTLSRALPQRAPRYTLPYLMSPTTEHSVIRL